MLEQVIENLICGDEYGLVVTRKGTIIKGICYDGENFILYDITDDSERIITEEYAEYLINATIEEE